MSIELISNSGNYWIINNHGWSNIMEIAEDYGWDPAGTVLYKCGERPSGLKLQKTGTEYGDGLEKDVYTYILETQNDTALYFLYLVGTRKQISEWDGGYNTNDNQVITTEDAKNFAKALNKAILDNQWKSKDDRKYINELIAFLEEGEVAIT